MDENHRKTARVPRSSTGAAEPPAWMKGQSRSWPAARRDQESARIAEQRNDRRRATDGAQAHPFKEIGRNTQEHREMQECERRIGDCAVFDAQPRNRRQDDGGMPEDHREYE